MKVLTIILLFFLEVLLPLAIAFGFVAHLRFLEKYTSKKNNTLKEIRKKDLPLFYSTDAVKTETLRKFLHIKPLKETVISRIAVKDLTLAAKYLERAVKKAPQNTKLLLLDAEIADLRHEQRRFHHIIEHVYLPRFMCLPLKAKFWHLKAKNELFQTDMMSASEHASKALKAYQKLNFEYEEAETYLTMAQIYRISGVFDVAFTMLKEAEKIYKKLNLYAKIAEVKAYFGLSEIGRENYKVATEYLENAEKICQKHKLFGTLADIENWLGLVAFLTNKYKRAEQYFTTALENAAHIPTKTFATEMLARIYLKNKEPEKALKLTDQALQYAKAMQHYPSIFESLYLKAEIFYFDENYPACREILTALIKEKTPPSAIYYPANAYTLLGLVEFQENNLDMACTLFKQALDLEHSKNRLKGAAIDYNNLAELSRRQGLLPEAEIYLKQALHYAEEIEDKELIKYLKSKL